MYLYLHPYVQSRPSAHPPRQLPLLLSPPIDESTARIVVEETNGCRVCVIPDRCALRRACAMQNEEHGNPQEEKKERRKKI